MFPQAINSIITNEFPTIGLCAVFSSLLALAITSASYFIALQNPDSEKNSSYECGFISFNDVRNKFNVQFYIVAILFLIFDIEVVYLFP